jgi:hypothetical protein
MGVLCAFALAGTSGCSGNYGKAEAATQDMIAAMNDIAAAMESVQDKETAKVAAPKIEAGIDKMQVAKNKLDVVKGTKAEKDKLEKEYMPKIEEAGARLKKVALTATLKSGGEPTFMKALEKMQTLK